MKPLTERDAERHLVAHALTPSYPGFVGLAVGLPVAGVPAVLDAGRIPLRHGFLVAESARSVVVSGPPSPGMEIAAARMAEDLDAAAALLGPSGAHTGVRVSLEAGTDDDGPTGLRRRWAVAQAIAPVLVAAFADTPADAGARMVRRCSWPAAAPAGDGPDPRLAWAHEVLDAPVSPPTHAGSPAAGATPAGKQPGSFREWVAGGGWGRAPTIHDLERHRRGYRAPVAARGHLEIDVVGPRPDGEWVVAAAVVSTLIDDAKAASEALAAVPAGPGLGERATRDGLADPAVAAAARALFLSAYGGLARRGAPRSMRDAVAAYAEGHVLRGLLDHRRSAQMKESHP